MSQTAMSLPCFAASAAYLGATFPQPIIPNSNEFIAGKDNVVERLLPHIHAFHSSTLIAPRTLTLEEIRVEFSKAPAEVDANHLRIAATNRILNNEGRFRVNVVPAGSEDIIHVNRNGCCPGLEELVTHRDVYTIIPTHRSLR